MNNISNLIRIVFYSSAFLIFGLILYRAWVIPLFYDEISTFFFYIRDGDLWPFSAHLDANNHLINSITSFTSYKIFGDSAFALRIPNALSFLLFVFYLWKIFLQFKSKILGSFFLFMMLLSVYVFEYFALTRGYGMSMAFLIAAIHYLLLIQKLNEPKNFIWLWIFTSLALWSNLGLMVVVMLLGLISVIFLVKGGILKKAKRLKLILGFGILYLLPLAFALVLSFRLKAADLLYHGHNYGIFKLTFGDIFIENFGGVIPAIIASSIIVFILLFTTIQLIKKKSVSPYKLSVVVLFIGTVAGLIAMNWILEVKYPSGRTAIYLYFLMIPAIYLLMDKTSNKKTIWLGLLPVFMMVFGFIMNVNTSYTHNWKQEIVPIEILEHLDSVEEEMPVITGRGFYGNIYNHHCYLSGKKHNRAYECASQKLSDYRITNAKYDEESGIGFDTISYDAISQTALLKNKRNFNWSVFDEIQAKSYSGKDEFYDLGQIDISDDKNTEYLFDFQFNLQSPDLHPNYWVVAAVFDGNDTQLDFVNIDLKYFMRNYLEPTEIHQKRILNNIPKNAEKIKFFVWNIDRKRYTIGDVGIDMLVLD